MHNALYEHVRVVCLQIQLALGGRTSIMRTPCYGQSRDIGNCFKFDIQIRNSLQALCCFISTLKADVNIGFQYLSSSQFICFYFCSHYQTSAGLPAPRPP